MSALAVGGTLTRNSMINIAKKTMWPPEGRKCQITTSDEPCTAVLVCWEAYRLHLIQQHCTAVKKKCGKTSSGAKQKEFHCPFQCPNYIHPSRKSLEQHMTSLHMSKIPLPCPFRKCEGLLLDSEFLLVDHVESFHNEELLIQDGQLLPSWWSPLHAIAYPPPPPLPSDSLNLLVIVTPHPHPHHQQPSSPPRTPRSVPSHQSLTRTDTLQSLHSPLNRSHIPRQITLESIADLKIMEEDDIEFADLPTLNESSSASSSSWCPQRSKPEDDWVIWRRPAVWRRENPRPSHLPKPDDYGHTPYGSILFSNVFSSTSRGDKR